MNDKQLVTLEDLEALYAKASGKAQNSLKSFQSAHTILERHLYAERLLKNDYHKVDWSEECKSPKDILNFAYLWMNPLVWQEPSTEPDLLIDGRIAKEVFDGDRFYEITDLTEYIYEQIILAYADSPTVFDRDILEAKFVKGMYDWSPLTWDVKTFIEDVIEGQEIDENELNKTYYNFIRLRYNLQLIAEKRSPKQAAKLLITLRNEWKKIKLNKTGFHLMEADDIAEFETQLFNNFDDLLSEWEGVTNSHSLATSILAITEETPYQMCAKEVIQIITEAKSKADACRKLMTNSKFIDFKDKTDDDKAAAVNPWVAQTNKDYVFTGDDFRKARNG